MSMALDGISQPGRAHSVDTLRPGRRSLDSKVFYYSYSFVLISKEVRYLVQAHCSLLCTQGTELVEKIRFETGDKAQALDSSPLYLSNRIELEKLFPSCRTSLAKLA